MSEPPVHTSADEVHAHPRHTGFKTLDLFLALTALAISSVSLFAAFQHGRTEQELVQANSWPILQMKSGFDPSGTTDLKVENAGVGPAKLETFQVLYKGQPVDSLRTLLHDCCGVTLQREQADAAFAEAFAIYSIGGLVLRPGDRETFIRLQGSASNHAATSMFLAASSNDISYRACYCSVFDQCWMSGLKDLHPAVVKQCPQQVVNFNQYEN